MFVTLQCENFKHIFETPAKSNIGKPPKSFMSISFDSPSQSQVPNLIQYCSWNAVTAHSKRARIHIWRKVWKTFFRTKLREFYCRWPPRKSLFAPYFNSGKGSSLMAITESYQENIFRLFFRVHFENDLYNYFCVLRCCSENLNRWLSLLPKKVTFGWVFTAQQGLFTGYNFD